MLNLVNNTILLCIKRFAPSNFKRINKNHLICCPTSVSSLPSAWSFGLLAGMCVFVLGILVVIYYAILYGDFAFNGIECYIMLL